MLLGALIGGAFGMIFPGIATYFLLVIAYALLFPGAAMWPMEWLAYLMIAAWFARLLLPIIVGIKALVAPADPKAGGNP